MQFIMNMNWKITNIFPKGKKVKKHTEIAAKFLAVFYRQNGFNSTYDFLLPYMKKALENDNYDYRTILQEYAQGKKLPFSYEILDREGPDNDLTFTCQLTIGKDKCSAKREEQENCNEICCAEVHYSKKYTAQI